MLVALDLPFRGEGAPTDGALDVRGGVVEGEAVVVVGAVAVLEAVTGLGGLASFPGGWFSTRTSDESPCMVWFAEFWRKRPIDVVMEEVTS